MDGFPESEVRNPVSSSKDGPVDEDSDAVVLPSLLLVRIATKALASRVVVWLIVADAIAFGAVMLLRINAYYSDLYNLARACSAAAVVLMSLSVFSLASVTKSDGHLSQLGSFGTGSDLKRVAKRAAKRLNRWNIGLLLFLVPMMLGAVQVSVRFGILGIDNPTNPNYHLLPGETELTIEQRLNGFFWGAYSCVVVPVNVAWYLTLKIAAVLVSDEVVETREMIKTTVVVSNSAAEWDEVVVPRVLALIDTTLPGEPTHFSRRLSCYPHPWNRSLTYSLLLSCALARLLSGRGRSCRCSAVRRMGQRPRCALGRPVDTGSWELCLVSWR